MAIKDKSDRVSVMKKLVLVLAFFLFGCGEVADEKNAIVEIGDQEFMVEIADTPELRKDGFMFRESLPVDEGMLFVFESESLRKFWMKNVNFDLDAVFISENLKVVDVKKMVICEKDPCEVYESGVPAKYVLEVVGGVFEGEIGDEVSLSNL
ncbi:MAG: DUF192 domain-containing protein [Candidatus Peregrinibacteria bacterium]|nr:DUF192 domain-containing protein [Candidatus Peregrinibacteria bacterium]